MKFKKKPAYYHCLNIKSIAKGKSFNFYEVINRSPDSSEDEVYNLTLSKKIKLDSGKIGCVICEKEIDLDEYWAYKQFFTIGNYYAFTVEDCRQCNNKSFQYTLLDRFDREQHIQTDVEVAVGKKVKCKINGFRKTYLHKSCLDLADLTVIIDKTKDVEEYEHYVSKTPSQWYGEVKDLGRHITRQSFTCNCCGGAFGPSKGYRIELRDLYFCNKCMKKIIEPTGNGYINIIYTNMGHKR